MKHKRFSVEQIVAVLKQAEAGLPVAELIHMFSVPGKPVYGLGRRRRVPDASQEAFYEIGLTRCSYWRFVVGGEFGDRALRLAHRLQKLHRIELRELRTKALLDRLVDRR